MSSKLVPLILAEYGAATRQVLSRYLPEREPRQYLYDLAADYPQRGGRALRPSLCIATTRAFGGRLEDALASAASIELFHNALLIHDDIEDESELRRGRPALHLQEGLPLALNAGDALLVLSFRPLFENQRQLGPDLALRILQDCERTAIESAEGQALDIGWRRDNVTEVTVADYLEMVLKKTCWLTTIYPSRVGALIGSWGRVDLVPFIRFGFLVGAAFQIQDDVLNLIGDEAAYGKELNGDIREGKRTLMLIHLLKHAKPDEKARVVELLGLPRHERTVEHVRWIRSRMDVHGCIEHARQVANGLAGAALREFSTVYGVLPASRDRQFIEELITWVIERN
ncbi:polyprenyl synthetase family protein [Archangium sp. Cb G35]|uniref:polyprenyl synthetase family protein n=1 Tax=Archangium sp. Cb G35 TaxID=1920190 RepID=UPI0018E9449A|nr:polyprenyl synthetase family protein [Archangium sp. Cb G35]